MDPFRRSVLKVALLSVALTVPDRLRSGVYRRTRVKEGAVLAGRQLAASHLEAA